MIKAYWSAFISPFFLHFNSFALLVDVWCFSTFKIIFGYVIVSEWMQACVRNLISFLNIAFFGRLNIISATVRIVSGFSYQLFTSVTCKLSLFFYFVPFYHPTIKIVHLWQVNSKRRVIIKTIGRISLNVNLCREDKYFIKWNSDFD